MVTHSSILAGRIPWMEEPGGLQSTGRRVGWSPSSLRPPAPRRKPQLRGSRKHFWGRRHLAPQALDTPRWPWGWLTPAPAPSSSHALGEARAGGFLRGERRPLRLPPTGPVPGEHGSSGAGFSRDTGAPMAGR